MEFCCLLPISGSRVPEPQNDVKTMLQALNQSISFGVPTHSSLGTEKDWKNLWHSYLQNWGASTVETLWNSQTFAFQTSEGLEYHNWNVAQNSII
jgi:hypothetical protein